MTTIVLEGDILDWLKEHSFFIREMANGDKLEMEKPDVMTPAEWKALSKLLGGTEAPLLARSHGRTIANPMHGLSKKTINRMIDFLGIDDEKTFRRLVQAVNAPTAHASTSAARRNNNSNWNNNESNGYWNNNNNSNNSNNEVRIVNNANAEYFEIEESARSRRLRHKGRFTKKLRPRRRRTRHRSKKHN
jgi:hypothetical protein